MKVNYRSKKNSLSFSVLALSLCLGIFASLCFADTAKAGKKARETEVVNIIPLNITADDNSRKAIKKSVEKFLLQRLNSGTVSAVMSEQFTALKPDEINQLYTSLTSKNGDSRIKALDPKGYVCGGDIVVLGTSVISDFFLYSIASGEKAVEHSSSGNDIGTVLTAADVFTGKVKSAFAEKRYTSDSEQPDLTSVRETPVKPVRLVAEKKILIKSEKVEGEITAVVFCKFDGTGKSYAVFSLPEKIVAMEILDDKCVVKSEFINTKSDKIIGLASIDTDQDGSEELVVSNIKPDNRTISSYVLKWENGKFSKKLSNLKWIFSSPGVAGENSYLYAQKHKTLKSTLDSGVLKVFFDKGEMLLREKALPIPEWVYLPGFASYGDSDVFGVAFKPDNRLMVFDKKGDAFWESNDQFGGTKLYMTESNPVDKERNKRVWLSSPVILADVYPENKYKEIITIKNDDSTKNFLSRVKSFKEGQITIISRKDMSCEITAQGEKISGYISDLDLKLRSKDSGNDSLLLYSVVQKGKTIFSDDNSFIVIQNIKSLHRISDYK